MILYLHLYLYLFQGRATDLNFNIATGTFLNRDTVTEFRVFYEIPRTSLTFVRTKDDEFFARFRVIFKLWQKEREWGDSWVIISPQDTSKVITGEVSIAIEPGAYDFNMKVEDLNSQRKGEKKDKIIVSSIMPDVSSLLFSVSSRRFIENKFLAYEIYNLSNQQIKAVHTVGEFCDSVLIDTVFITPIKFELPLDAIGYGRQIVKISINALLETGEDTEFGVEFYDTLEIEEPFWAREYETRVNELYYISSVAERRALLRVPMSERDSVWREFWQKKEEEFNRPGIEEEYFRRVDYANKNFASIRKGWETDRGRIYILLGEPDDIDSYPFETGQPPYEIWRYNFIRIDLIFADRRGFGNYELQTPYWDTRIYFK